MAAEAETGGGMRFGVNYFSTHNHYEPYYLSDEELHRDFKLFQDQGLEYITLCAIWKYLEPELGNYNEKAIDDLVRVCDFASRYNLKVVINFYTMMSNDSWTMPEWLSPRKFEAVFLNGTARQAWLGFLNHSAARLDSLENIWSWNMMNEPWRGEWACDVSIDDFLQLWVEMKAVFKAYSDRPVSVRFAAQAFEDPNHFNSDPRIYTLFDYLALNYYEYYCPSENLTRIVLDAQQSGYAVVISEFGSNATDDVNQASDYQRILGLFRSLGLTDCIAWMWRADYDLGGPDLPGFGYNLAKDVDGTSRPAFLLLDNVEYGLTIAVEGSGSTVPAVGSHMYGDGTEVEVAATPDTGWMFDHWELDTADIGTNNPITVIMDDNKSLTAVFEMIPEFPSWIILPLIITIAIAIILIKKKILSKEVKPHLN